MTVKLSKVVEHDDIEVVRKKALYAMTPNVEDYDAWPGQICRSCGRAVGTPHDPDCPRLRMVDTGVVSR